MTPAARSLGGATPENDAPAAGRRHVVLETDGGSRGNPGPAGYGAVVRDVDGHVLAERADYLGVTTNNVAEYTGLVEGLRAVREIDPEAVVEVRADSKLLVEQMSGRWQVKHEDMRRLAREAREAFPPERVRYRWIPRAQNAAADALANAAMDARGPVSRDPAEPGTASKDRHGRSGGPRDGSGGGPATAQRALGATLLPGTGDPVTVVLLRHGQTDATAARTYAGGDGPGASLNARGRTEAAQVADLVHRIGRDLWPDLPTATAVLSSSMLRAQQTAAAVGRRLGRRVEVDDAFAECRFGEWEGLTASEIGLRWPGEPYRWLVDPTIAAAGGESMTEVARRFRSGVSRLVRDHAGHTVVVSTHTVTIRAGVGSTIGMAPAGWSRLRVPPASLTVVRVWPDGYELTAFACPGAR